jgi:hypothetical protein
VSDGVGTTTSSFVLTVIPVNDAPSISQITDQTINEDTVLGPVSFIVGDVETPAESLVVTGTSDNPLLVAENQIFLTGSGSNRALTITPATNQFGSATITITASDGALMTSNSFLLIVSPVNDAPTLDPVANLGIFEGAVHTVRLIGISSGVSNEFQNITISAVSSDPDLLPNPVIHYNTPAVSGELILAPVSGATGSSRVTISVEDDGNGSNTTTRTFEVTIFARPFLEISRSGESVSISFNTVSGKSYSMEYRDATSDGPWNSITNVPGTGNRTTLVDGPISDASRFYRVRME